MPFSFSSFNLPLIAAAVIPAIVLMIFVYKQDRLEREPFGFLVKLVLWGILATALATILEKIGYKAVALFCRNENVAVAVIYFIVVAYAEEGSKYALLRSRTWKNPEFNCQFDGLIYAVFVSLGFALWENILYVIQMGWGTALIRAVTAVPGHCCFGVFMGVFYGAARRLETEKKHGSSVFLRVLAVIVPALVHGAYDYICVSDLPAWYFYAFIAVMFVISFLNVKKASKNDRYIA